MSRVDSRWDLQCRSKRDVFRRRATNRHSDSMRVADLVFAATVGRTGISQNIANVMSLTTDAL